ncbi:hypothetical protein AB6N01_01200 [Alcaligenes nematophilus]|uniref:hypothetical protein n=1 Tax=Alcaligenes nematophilus TaxID=2994643 RepID=UPI0034E0D5AD
MLMQVKVLGMKRSKGVMDNGMAFDSTKLFVETKLDDSKGDAKGYGVATYAFGKSEEFGKFAHLPFPMEAEIDVEAVTSGSVVKWVINDLRPVKPAVKAN